MLPRNKGKLVLEDGSIFEGFSFGAEKDVSGEVVFNTGMVGYPESFTDPSYKGQILVLTYPIIGNYGVPSANSRISIAISNSDVSKIIDFFESESIKITALVVDYYSEEYSHYTAARSLGLWLESEGVPALYGIDTRALTKKLREKGVMLGKMLFCRDASGGALGGASGGAETKGQKIDDPNDRNLAAEVSCSKIIVYNANNSNNRVKKVLLYDCGVKYNIIRSLLKRGVSVIRVPWNFNPAKSDDLQSDLHYDGVLVSNGPGDPKSCVATIDAVKWHLSKDKPLFGICLGNQILALAAGGDTYKLKYGHRSQNQPCIEAETKRCYITSQNHGYAVNMKTLSLHWREFFANANDGTNEGMMHTSKPFFSVQFHPEATPGPVDTGFLFDKFVKMMDD